MTVVLGGTFDPVHMGHLHAACVAADILDASVLMVLSARPVHRDAPVASVDDRWRMLRTACADFERLVPSDIELLRKGPSYAADTLVFLNGSHRDPVIWVLGADAFDSVHTWHRFDEFANRCSFLVFTRPGSLSNRLPSGFKSVNDLSVLTRSSGIVYFGEQAMKKISATKLRQDLAQGCADENSVPSGVWEYLHRRGLYLT